MKSDRTPMHVKKLTKEEKKQLAEDSKLKKKLKRSKNNIKKAAQTLLNQSSNQSNQPNKIPTTNSNRKMRTDWEI